MFEGVYTALITPFRDGEVDYDSLDRVIEHQIQGGVTGVLPMGTTGESPTVSHDEHITIIRHVIGRVNGRGRVLAGTGSNSTTEAVYLSQEAEKAGADAVLLVNPYYNKPPQRALVEHFAAVADAVNVPVVLYNIPGRTGINFLPESVEKLCKRCDNVVAIKEASGSIQQMMEVKERLGDRIALMSGDDNLTLPVLAVGGTGVVSVLSNIIPADVVRIVQDYRSGDVDKARDAFFKLLPLCRMMFLETNPIPIKAAMAKAGFCTGEIRKPLLRLTDENEAKLMEAFTAYGAPL
ncbi:MAG: 4-hydroxy-tetrahydrodipicolinate synthase [Spirochaetota bacterium]